MKPIESIKRPQRYAMQRRSDVHFDDIRDIWADAAIDLDNYEDERLFIQSLFH